MNLPNILMIGENYFPLDVRVRKEAYSLKKHYNITVIALKRKSEKFIEVLDDITIFRIPELPNLNLAKLSYILQYFYFTLCASFIFICTLLKRRYKVIHVHNPPDTLFFIGLLGKIFRIKFVFDHHDLSPELYLTRFSEKRDFAYKTLIFFEKLSCKLADVVICTNESYKKIEMTRHNICDKKIYIVRNNPIITECSTNKDNNRNDKENDKESLLFLGSINPQDGVDILLHALRYLVNDFNKNNFICNIIGDGDSLDSLKLLAKQLNLTDYVDFKGMIFDREKIKEYLSSSDIGIEPAPDNELNRHSTFIKVMEYMAAGKPIIAFDLKETRYSADGSAILVTPGNVEGFACAIQKLMNEPRLREELGKIGFERVKKELTWEKAAANLVIAYKSLNI